MYVWGRDRRRGGLGDGQRVELGLAWRPSGNWAGRGLLRGSRDRALPAPCAPPCPACPARHSLPGPSRQPPPAAGPSRQSHRPAGRPSHPTCSLRTCCTQNSLCSTPMRCQPRALSPPRSSSLAAPPPRHTLRPRTLTPAPASVHMARPRPASSPTPGPRTSPRIPPLPRHLAAPDTVHHPVPPGSPPHSIDLRGLEAARRFKHRPPPPHRQRACTGELRKRRLHGLVRVCACTEVGQATPAVGCLAQLGGNGESSKVIETSIAIWGLDVAPQAGARGSFLA